MLARLFMALAVMIPGHGSVAYGQVQRELARRGPVHFGHWASGGKFTRARHLRYISERVAAGIERGGYRGIICAPPRHAKSSLLSENTPGWFLNRWPEKRVILCAYGDEFAATWGRKVRDLIVGNQGRLDVSVQRGKDAAVDEWLTTKGGGMKTSGAGGGILGRGADLMIIDDPVKNAAEAYSPTYQQRLRDWYQSTASTRLEPGASVIVTMQRWPSTDFVSWLIDQGAEGREQWELIKLPAIAEDDDAIGRAPGEALWPERYDVAALERFRLSLEDEGFWLSQWQQQPPDGRRQGLAYHAFNAAEYPAGNTMHSSYVRGLPICLACDFNVDPMAWLIAQVDPGIRDASRADDRYEGRTIRILDEIYLRNTGVAQVSTQAAAEEFINRCKPWLRHGQRMEVAIYGDRSGRSRKTTAPADFEVIADVLRHDGRFVFNYVNYALVSDPPVRDRVTKTNNAFRNAAGEIHLTVDPRCKELRKDLGFMRWKRDLAGNPTGELDKSNALRSHISDALGYLVWREFGGAKSGGPRGYSPHI